LHLLLHTYDVLKVFYSMGDGLRQSMSYSDVAKLSAIIPPLPEQKQIVEYLDKKTKKINSLIENINRQIELLQEYKQRLIADVVTGKVNVQNVKID
ncbi:MAG: restriction endonuclease subunit S, partial [Bacteroidales bacterium]|nr:restriction endonuclease subunit S [Bacteroidales bacterium]